MPKHSILSDKEKERLLKDHNIALEHLPKILSSDPAIRALGAKVDDIIKIERKSPTTVSSLYYRRVING